MQPLHGIATVLETAVMLQHDEVEFVLIGGKAVMKQAVVSARKKGANIDYRSWVPFEELPDIMRSSQLSLGGPFGGTRQADHVITGKTYQSLACGVATVVGAGLATDEVFTDKQDALLVPQADAAALAEQIRWAVAHDDELVRIAQAGRELYEKQFSTAPLAGRIRPLIESLPA